MKKKEELQMKEEELLLEDEDPGGWLEAVRDDGLPYFRLLVHKYRARGRVHKDTAVTIRCFRAHARVLKSCHNHHNHHTGVSTQA